MIGAICKRDVLAHPMVTIRCFGWQVFFQALVAGRKRTFLSLVMGSSAARCSPVPLPDLIRRCANLELRAKSIYELLARCYRHHGDVSRLFTTLARQEQCHFELLELCALAAGGQEASEACFERWQQMLPRLARQMRRAEAKATEVTTVAEALSLVVAVESSEVNELFAEIVESSRSEFVRRLNVFREAGEQHLAYIGREIPSLAPELAEACRQLLATSSGAPAIV